MNADTFEMILSKIEKRILKNTFSRSYFSEGKISCMPQINNTFFIVAIRNLLMGYLPQNKKINIVAHYSTLTITSAL